MKKQVTKDRNVVLPVTNPLDHEAGNAPNGAPVSVLDNSAPEGELENGAIIVRGARVHNLKGVDCEIPGAETASICRDG